MTVVLDDWPDVLHGCRERTATLGGEAGTYVPDDVAGRMPYRHFYLQDGQDDGISERSLVGVDIYADSYTAGRDHAGAVRQLLLATPWHVTVPGGRIVVADLVTTSKRPVEVPWGDSRVRRWVSSYWVTQRR